MQQPFMIVFPLFISVFVVRVLPRVVLAPVALVLLLVLNRWVAPGIDAGAAGQAPQHAADRATSYSDSTSRLLLPLP